MCAVLVGAYMVHQLRYVLAYRSGAADALAEQGHTYLAQAVCPLIGSLLALAAGQLLWALARPVPISRRGASRLALAASAAGAVLGVYTAQELLEGALAAGHPVGLDGVIGSGGWLALPLSLLVGIGVALLLVHVEEAAEDTRVRVPFSIRLTLPLVVLTPAAPERPRNLCIGRHIAGRGPPLPML